MTDHTDLLARADDWDVTQDERGLIEDLAAALRATLAQRDAARDELLEKWELYRACNGAEVYDEVIPKIRKLYMQLNAKARGDESDVEGDPIEQWNRLIDLTVTAVLRWMVANRWAVNEHQRCEKVDARVAELEAAIHRASDHVPAYLRALVSPPTASTAVIGHVHQQEEI
jgi:hypothetical protein